MANPTQTGSVVAAFPATGKSYYAATRTDALDSDSSRFSWRWLGPDTRERHPDWPANYMAHIREALKGLSTVLVSTHAEVREALAAEGIPFTLVYPSPAQRRDYRDRMERRGSPEPLVRKVIDELWDEALISCAGQAGCVHVVLRPGEHLADVMPA